jgi:hypothetical protein
MMHWLLFVLYTIVIVFLQNKIPLFKNSGIKWQWLIVFFGLRVSTGCFHNWVAWHYFPNHGDVWQSFTESIVMKNMLLQEPARFFNDCIPLQNGFNPLNSSSFLYLFSYRFIQYLHTFLNFFSATNLYINTLLFSFFSFSGSLVLYKVFQKKITRNHTLISISVLLLPSTLFWTSCVFKEGLLYSFLGILLYQLEAIRQQWSIKRGILVILCVAAIAIFRNNILLPLVPFLIIWQVGEYTKRKKIHIVLITLLGMVGLFTLLAFVNHKTNLLAILTQRQLEFLVLEGNSRIFLPALDGTFPSFLQALPVAIFNGFFQPIPGSGGHLLYTGFALELYVCWMVVIVGVWKWFVQKKPAWNDFERGGLVFACIGLFFIGLIVPFSGAIVRYRSIFLPFLLAPFLNFLNEMKWLRKLNDRLGIFFK